MRPQKRLQISDNDSPAKFEKGRSKRRRLYLLPTCGWRNISGTVMRFCQWYHGKPEQKSFRTLNRGEVKIV